MNRQLATILKSKAKPASVGPNMQMFPYWLAIYMLLIDCKLSSSFLMIWTQAIFYLPCLNEVTMPQTALS